VNRCHSHRSSRKMALTPASESRLRDRLATAHPVVRLLVLLALIAIFVLAQRDAAAQSQEPSPKTAGSSTGNAQNGKLMYASHGCENCHGSEAQGAVGPRIGPSPIPFSAFVTSVRQPTGQMPPSNSEAVSDSALADIYAFLKVVPQSSQTDASPGGNAENGKKLFTKYGCYECHGYQGQGSMLTGARLAPDPIPLSALIAYCRKPKGEMPPFSAKLVSDQDLTDIHAYLRSLPRPPDAKTIPILQQ
jgi:mono/diheme cytochrome c family protein